MARNEIAIDHAGKIYWNGDLVSAAQLDRYLREGHGLNPEPEFFLEAEMGVSCRALEQLRDRMDEALECKKPYPRCAEGVLSIWRGLPIPPGTPPS